MPALTYPDTLPTPSAWTQQRAERRRLRDLREPANAARVQWRDPIINAQAEWRYTAAEMAVWKAWLEGPAADQVARLRWFTARLPGRGGLIARVCRYMAPPERSLMGGGIWRVTVPLQVRGAGVAPQQAATVAGDTGGAVLREDGTAVLREDGSEVLRG